MAPIDLYLKIKIGVIRVTQYSPMEYRFWKRVDKEGPIHPILGQCWQWIGYKLKTGYGKFTWGLAHRYSWSVHRGEIPDGISVLHQCDNPSCVNPDHLFLGTQLGNMMDMQEKGRSARGEKQGSSKLTEAEVLEIRQRYRRYSHKHGSGALAKQYGVSLTEIWRIVHGERWGHL